MVLIPTWTTCNTLLWVDFCLSKQSVTFPAQQPAKLTQRAEFGQNQTSGTRYEQGQYDIQTA